MSTLNTLRLGLHYSPTEYCYEDFKDFSSGTNFYRPKVWTFSNSSDGEVHGSVVLPETFDQGQPATVRLALVSQFAGSGGEQIQFELQAKSYGASASLQPSAGDETVSVIQSVATMTAKTLVLADIAVTETLWMPGLYHEFKISRRNAVASNHPHPFILCAAWIRGYF